MASLAVTSAGTRLYVSASLPATYNSAGFGALSWTEVGEITDFGEWGKEYSVVNHNPVGTRQTIKRKGSYNNGALTLSMARATTDAGQTILIAASDSDNSYSFKVAFQGGATGQFFTGVVPKYTTNVGSVDSIFSASVSVEIDNDIISY